MSMTNFLVINGTKIKLLSINILLFASPKNGSILVACQACQMNEQLPGTKNYIHVQRKSSVELDGFVPNSTSVGSGFESKNFSVLPLSPTQDSFLAGSK